AGWPREVIDLELQPPVPGARAGLLGRAAAQRPEVVLARQAVVAAQEGRDVARAEFRPRIFVRGSVGNTSGQNVETGWQEGAGLHMQAPLYARGGHPGALPAAEADVQAPLA